MSLESLLGILGAGFGILLLIEFALLGLLLWLFVKGFKLATSNVANNTQKSVGVGLMLLVVLIFLAAVFLPEEEEGDSAPTRYQQSSQTMYDEAVCAPSTLPCV